MSLRIRRGTDAQRKTVQLDSGELAYTTDTQQLFVGDGTTIGGRNILTTSAGSGLIFDNLTQTLKLQNPSGITSVSQDTSPSIGGNLDLNSFSIIGTGNISVMGYFAARQHINASPAASLAAQRSRGTAVSPLTVNAADYLGGFSFSGYTSSTNYARASTISALVSSRYPVTSTVVPGKIEFYTNDNAGISNKVMDLDADQGVRHYQTNPGTTALAAYSYLSQGAAASFTNFGRYSGTVLSPTVVATGDQIHALRFQGYDGTNLIVGSQITSTIYGAITAGSVRSDIKIQCRNVAGIMSTTTTFLSDRTTFAVMPVLPTYAGTAAATAAVGTAINGMMFYDSTTSKITGYQNNAWVALI